MEAASIGWWRWRESTNMLTQRLFILCFCQFRFLAVRRTFSPSAHAGRVLETHGGILARLTLTPYALQGPPAVTALSVFPSQGSPIFPSSLLHVSMKDGPDFPTRVQNNPFLAFYVRISELMKTAWVREALSRSGRYFCCFSSSTPSTAHVRALDYPALIRPSSTRWHSLSDGGGSLCPRITQAA
jgi:hypothetical protein